ncbi:MAG: iron uptake system protein EfeO [Rothia sp. (in: high G+C Gram-positive bacteria)]|nr:iron uptake system protein EfeO [Rothia sp. (in: high G+C Gram-positive bacteria)]
MKKTLTTLSATTLALFSLSACTPNNAVDGGVLTVRATDSECSVSASEAKAGTLTFIVKNEGSTVNEFYVVAEDGLRVLSEVENIGPGLSRDLTVQLAEGKYNLRCKPGMVGEGITSTFTVAANPDATEVPADEQALRDEAVSQYTAYVKDQIEQLKTKTDEFAAAYKSGDDERARSLYAAARLHFERVEPVAESFGDLDPKLDAREADLEEGQPWTGWHRAEKDLWAPSAEANGGKQYTALTSQQRSELADQLVADTQSLYEQTRELDITVDQITNGAKGLLDEVAATKVTGEEEVWSHTDLSDFQGNIDGARVAFDTVRPIVEGKDAALAADLDTKFAAVQQLLDQYRRGETFVSYTDLTEQQVRELSDAIDALSEPLSKLTGLVVG